MNKIKYIYAILFLGISIAALSQNPYSPSSHKYIKVKSIHDYYDHDWAINNNIEWANKEIIKQLEKSKKFVFANENSNLNDILTIEIISLSHSFSQFNIYTSRTPTDDPVQVFTSYNMNKIKHINKFLKEFINNYSYNNYLGKKDNYYKYRMKAILERLENNNLDNIEGVYNYFDMIKNSSGNYEKFPRGVTYAIVKASSDTYDVLKFNEESPEKVTSKYAEIFKSKLNGYKLKLFTYNDNDYKSNDLIEFIDDHNFICTKQNPFGAYVTLMFEKVYPYSKVGKKTPNSEWVGNGTGFFINNIGLIATNAHVVDGANEISIEIYSGDVVTTHSAELICSDLKNDLAILKIDASKLKLNVPYKIDSRPAEVAEKVFTLGYPMALNGMGKDVKYTEGVISSITGLNKNFAHYQTTTPIQGGNSGGPLFDSKNNVIGIVSSKLVNTEIENVGYAIKAIYLLTLTSTAGIEISETNSNISNIPKPEAIKIIDDYVVLIKIK